MDVEGSPAPPTAAPTAAAAMKVDAEGSPAPTTAAPTTAAPTTAAPTEMVGEAAQAQDQESFPAVPGDTVAAAEPEDPESLPALAAPGAPNEESSELNRPSASSYEESIEDEGVDFGGDEEPTSPAAAGEGSQEAGDVVKDCWDIYIYIYIYIFLIFVSVIYHIYAVNTTATVWTFVRARLETNCWELLGSPRSV